MSSETAFPTETRAAPSASLSLAWLASLIALVVVAAGITLRAVDARNLKTWTDAQAVPTVNLIQPMRDATGPSLELPGTARGVFAGADFRAG